MNYFFTCAMMFMLKKLPNIVLLTIVGHILIEHNVDDNLSMVLKPNLENVSQESDDESNYYEVIRIMFDNSEQEIMDEK